MYFKKVTKVGLEEARSRERKKRARGAETVRSGGRRRSRRGAGPEERRGEGGRRRGGGGGRGGMGGRRGGGGARRRGIGGVCGPPGLGRQDGCGLRVDTSGTTGFQCSGEAGECLQAGLEGGS